MISGYCGFPTFALYAMSSHGKSCYRLVGDWVGFGSPADQLADNLYRRRRWLRLTDERPLPGHRSIDDGGDNSAWKKKLSHRTASRTPRVPLCLPLETAAVDVPRLLAPAQ